MKILTDIHPATLAPSVATIGFFDGVHRGHRFLIDQVKEVAAAEGLCSALVTFPLHPRQVIQTAYRPQLLSSPEEKLTLLAESGTDYCILLPFTPELSRLTAKEFMQLLRDRYHIRTLVIGYDHRFGHNRTDSFEDYLRYGEELHINIVRARAYTDEGDKISSSVIRQLLREGNVAHAARFLGYPYHLDGTVVGGYQVGRKIGFPTANLQPNYPDKLLPAVGVYAVRVRVDGQTQTYKGMLNIGHRPTLNNGTDLSIEVHLLDFSGDLYHKPMSIEFVDYLRPEVKYDHIDTLVAQMYKDKELVKTILA